MSPLATVGQVPDEIQLPTLLVAVLVIGAVATAIYAVVRLAERTGIGLTWLRRKVVEPERTDLEELRDKVDQILAELRPDHGASMRDGVTRIENEQKRQGGLLDEHIEFSAQDRKWLHERLNGVQEQLPGGDG